MSYVPLISSGVAGPLGALHLPRLWLKANLKAAGELVARSTIKPYTDYVDMVCNASPLASVLEAHSKENDWHSQGNCSGAGPSQPPKNIPRQNKGRRKNSGKIVNQKSGMVVICRTDTTEVTVSGGEGRFDIKTIVGLLEHPKTIDVSTGNKETKTVSTEQAVNGPKEENKSSIFNLLASLWRFFTGVFSGKHKSSHPDDYEI